MISRKIFVEKRIILKFSHCVKDAWHEEELRIKDTCREKLGKVENDRIFLISKYDFKKIKLDFDNKITMAITGIRYIHTQYGNLRTFPENLIFA